MICREQVQDLHLPPSLYPFCTCSAFPRCLEKAMLRPRAAESLLMVDREGHSRALSRKCHNPSDFHVPSLLPFCLNFLNFINTRKAMRRHKPGNCMQTPQVTQPSLPSIKHIAPTVSSWGPHSPMSKSCFHLQCKGKGTEAWKSQITCME